MPFLGIALDWSTAAALARMAAHQGNVFSEQPRSDRGISVFIAMGVTVADVVTIASRDAISL